MKHQTISTGIASSFVVLASLFSFGGCVNLDQPENVRRCASSPQGCSDNADAALAPDVAPDVPGDRTPDLVSDIVVEGVADRPDATPDQSAPDAADAGTDSGKADRVFDDLGGFDTQTVDSTVGDLPRSPDLDEPDAPAEEVARLDAEEVVDVAPAPDLPPVLDVTVDQTRLDTQALTCMQQLKANDYAASPAPPCSVCKDNNTLLDVKCKALIDCLVPLSSRDVLDCQNKVGASAVVSNCVNALTKAACPNGF